VLYVIYAIYVLYVSYVIYVSFVLYVSVLYVSYVLYVCLKTDSPDSGVVTRGEGLQHFVPLGLSMYGEVPRSSVCAGHQTEA
jgi:hypothetical protein